MSSRARSRCGSSRAPRTARTTAAVEIREEAGRLRSHERGRQDLRTLLRSFLPVYNLETIQPTRPYLLKEDQSHSDDIACRRMCSLPWDFVERPFILGENAQTKPFRLSCTHVLISLGGGFERNAHNTARPGMYSGCHNHIRAGVLSTQRRFIDSLFCSSLRFAQMFGII